MHLIAALRASNENGASFSKEAAEALQHRRDVPRRSLMLSAVTNTPSVGESRVVIRDISMGGLLVETEPDVLSKEDAVEIELPERGIVRAHVVWQSGRFFGCQFSEPVSAAAISAALLRSDPISTPGEPPTAQRAATSHPDNGKAIKPQLNFAGALLLSLTLWALIGSALYLLILRSRHDEL